MAKLEIQNALTQQFEVIYELIETLPTPELWAKEFGRVVSEYKRANLLNNDTGMNYIKSGIRDFVLRLIGFAKTLGIEDSVDIIQRDTSFDALMEMSVDDLVLDTIQKPHANTVIKVYPQRLIECIEIYQQKIDSLPKVSIIAMDICQCGAKMKIDLESGCISCSVCGLFQESALALFKEDRSASSTETQKVKSNTYKVSKHFETWLNRILAIEVRPGAHLLVPKIKEYFKNIGVPKDLIEYTGIRNYLKKNSLNDYYESVSWFLKEVTGRTPPELTDTERMDIAYRFDVIIETFDKIRNSTDVKPSGRTYYPFFIYKIIQTKFANNPEKLRLLNYIHVQNEKTLKKNKALYYKILAEARNSKLSEEDP